jgi:hypothetical protein
MKKILLLAALPVLCLVLISATFIKKGDSNTIAASGGATFQELLKEFPKGTMPFTVSVSEMRDIMSPPKNSRPRALGTLSTKYGRILPDATGSKFSRMPEEVAPIKAFETPDNYVLVYLMGHFRYFGSGQYYAAVFDKKGNLKNKALLASFGHNTITSGNLAANGTITRTEFDVQWTEDGEGSIKSITKKKTDTVALLPNAAPTAPTASKRAEP